MRQLELQPAYILHTRAYRETSVLLDVLTLNHGRLSLIAKGAKRPKHPWRHVLMPFNPIALSWAGRHELQTLTQAEFAATHTPVYLRGNALFCGFYLNELLLHFLPKQDPYPEIFTLYQQTVTALLLSSAHKSLRSFERQLLALLGYEIPFLYDDNQQDIQAESFYHFQYDKGFIRLDYPQDSPGSYPGWVLRNIAVDNYEDTRVLSYAKRLFRGKIQYLLGEKTIKSREMYF